MRMLAAAGSARTIPVVPDADQARDWARQELSLPVYQEARPSLLDRFWGWVGDLLADLFNGFSGMDPTLGVLLLAAVAAAVLAAVLYLVRPRLNARRRKELFDAEDIREAVDHRALAEEAAARGEWATALAERLRALIRSAEERVILEPRPGRTAAEAGQALAASFPSAAGEITWLARRFDEVQYGHLSAGSADVQRARSLDELLERSSPSVSQLPAPGTFPAVPR